MLLTLEICENTIRAWKYIGLLLYILKLAVGLIVIITSTFTIWNVLIKGTADQAFKAAFGIGKKIAAAIVVLLIPTIIINLINLTVNTGGKEEFAACEACIKAPDSEICNEFVVAYDNSVKEEIKKFEDQVIEGSLDTCDMGFNGSPPLDFSYKGNGSVPAQFSSTNLKIVEQHLNDFTYENYHQFIDSQKGFLTRDGHKAYAKKLGSIYKKYYGKTWKGESYSDLQQASEYVFGYMTMYGFDYFNGTGGENSKYCKWGGGCLWYSQLLNAIKHEREDQLDYPTGSSDAFYPGDFRYETHGLSEPRRDFDALLKGDNMTTNCNWSVDMVYWKAGIFRDGTRKDGTPEYQESTEFDKQAQYGKIITKPCDLRVGDILHFFAVPVDPTDRNTWNGWKHVAFIGEIDAETGIVTVYDGGSYQQTNRNYKWTFSAKGERPASLHGYAGWTAVRIKELSAN